MPEKYEREIEDILRNLKRTEQKAGARKRTGVYPGTSLPTLSFSEWCLLIALIAALFAGGWAYANGGGNLITGLIALIGAVCLTLVTLSSFMVRHHSLHPPDVKNFSNA